MPNRSLLRKKRSTRRSNHRCSPKCKKHSMKRSGKRTRRSFDRRSSVLTETDNQHLTDLQKWLDGLTDPNYKDMYYKCVLDRNCTSNVQNLIKSNEEKIDKEQKEQKEQKEKKEQKEQKEREEKINKELIAQQQRCNSVRDRMKSLEDEYLRDKALLDEELKNNQCSV